MPQRKKEKEKKEKKTNCVHFGTEQLKIQHKNFCRFFPGKSANKKLKWKSFIVVDKFVKILFLFF